MEMNWDRAEGSENKPTRVHKIANKTGKTKREQSCQKLTQESHTQYTAEYNLVCYMWIKQSIERNCLNRVENEDCLFVSVDLELTTNWKAPSMETTGENIRECPNWALQSYLPGWNYQLKTKLENILRNIEISQSNQDKIHSDLQPIKFTCYVRNKVLL